MVSTRIIRFVENALIVRDLEDMTVITGRIWIQPQKLVCKSVTFLTYKRLVICLDLSLVFVVVGALLTFAPADSKNNTSVSATYNPISTPSESPSHSMTPTFFS